MPQVSQHPTFRRAPRTGRRADSSRAASSAAAARYRPAHRATSGASPRPYQPVGTRFNPPQITQPLPRVESPHREQLHEGGAPVSRGVRASAARPDGSRATRGRGAHISAAPRPHVRDARVEERHSRGGAAQVHRPHEARAAALHARVQREAARPEASNSAPRVPRSRELALFALAALAVLSFAFEVLPLGGTTLGSVADASYAWIMPAGHTMIAWVVVVLLWAVWLVAPRFSMPSRQHACPTQGSIYTWFVMLVAAAATWMVAWHLQALAPALIAMVVALVAAGVLFVAERMAASPTRSLPFSFAAGWFVVLALAALSALVGPAAEHEALVPGVFTIAVIGFLFCLTFLARRLFDDVAFGIAVVWGAIGVGVHVAERSALVAAFVFAAVAVGCMGAFVPWEALSHERQHASRPRVRGGAAATHRADVHPRVRVGAPPATRVATPAAPRPTRTRTRGLSSASRIAPRH